MAIMMELLSDTSALSLWLLEYGSLVLFILLALGIIAFPIPEESLMTLAGILMREGKLNMGFTLLSAYAGTIVGITVSYLLGKTAGSYLVHTYGPYIGISASRLKTVHDWFERIGKWVLTVGYFIPGIRHLTGFFAGTSELKYTHFALFAYSGALIWVSTFLLLGYYFGDYVFNILKHLEVADWVILLVALLFFLVIFFIAYRHMKNK